MRSSSSKEYLLGFDKLSGEEELAKADVVNDSTDQYVAVKDEAVEDVEEPKEFSENRLGSSKISKKVIFQKQILF